MRTDISEKHRGITWVICDMRSAGVEIRPIQAMARVSHFCEVFYEDVRIPLSNVVGEINGGWSVAQTTFSFERGTGFMAEQMELVRTVDNLIDLARKKGFRAAGPIVESNGTSLDERLAITRG